jgi:hypothetical protein
MEIFLSFDIGSYSTKVSFLTKGKNETFVTREFVNAVLFTSTSEKFYGEEALQKVQDDPEKFSGSLVTNFFQLLLSKQSDFLTSDENYYTYTKVKAHADADRLTFKLNPSGTFVTPEKCLTYFLAFIKRTIISEFYEDKIQETAVRAIICVDSDFSYFHRLLLKEVFTEAAYKESEFVFRGFALSCLYTKMHNYLVNRKVLFVDVGYSKISLMVVTISPSEISLDECHTIQMGMRDFDFEVYLHILRDLKIKYGIDYQKDKRIRQGIMNRIGTLRKGFNVNGAATLNLKSAFGSRYFDQCVNVDYPKYKSLNKGNFERFKLEVEKLLKDLSVDDFQIIGGGAGLNSLGRAVRSVIGQSDFVSDKMTRGYSSSQGALLQGSFKLDFVTRAESTFRIEFCIKNEQNIENEGSHEDKIAEKLTEKSLVLREGKKLSHNSIPDDSIADHLPEDGSIRESQYPDINQKIKKTKKLPLIPESDQKSEIKKVKKTTPTVKATSKIEENQNDGNIAADFNSKPNSITLFEKNEKILLRNYSKHIELPSLIKKRIIASNPFSVEMIITCEDSSKNISSDRIILKQVINQHFDSLTFTVDSNLFIKAFILEPSKKEIAAEIYNHTDFEVSKISRFDPQPVRRHDHADIVINVDFKEHKSHKSQSNSCDHNHKGNPLVNATFFHIISDFVQDLFLLATGIFLYFKPEWEIIDPILSILISLFIIFFVVRYTYKLFERLMETCPADINYQKILSQLINIKGVIEVHDLHVWDLGDQKFAATAHLISNEEKDRVLKDATLIFRKHNIYHSTVQVESPNGKNDPLYINCDNNIDIKVNHS